MRVAIFWCLNCLSLIVASLVLLIPAVLIYPFSVRLSRRYTAVFVSTSWFTLTASMIELICGVKFVLSGDARDTASLYRHAVIISNHGCISDMTYSFNLLYRMSSLSSVNYFSAERFKRTPFFGWLGQMHHMLFVKRNWEVDKDYVLNSMHYLCETGPHMNMFIYPEGYVMSVANKAADREYAKKNNLKLYNNLLHPRIRGFVKTIQILRECGREAAVDVYDVATGYVEKPQDVSLWRNISRNEVHFHIKHYPSSSLPSSDEELSEWLRKRWSEKDELLTQFYETKSFPGPFLQETWWSKMIKMAVLVKWLVLCAAVMYSLIQAPLLMTCVLGTPLIIHYTVTKWFDGWDKLTLRRWTLKNN